MGSACGRYFEDIMVTKILEHYLSLLAVKNVSLNIMLPVAV